MKISKVIAMLLGVAGACAACLCIALSFQNIHASPLLLKQPESAREQIVTLMEAVSGNDYEAASSVIYGQPSFSADREPADAVGGLIWNAFTQSVSYEMVGQLYATDSGVAQKITVTALDISSVTENLKERSENLLEKRVNEAEDQDEVYNANNEYREEFVMQVLYDAAVQALQEDARTVTCEVAINMVCEDGRWWIVADSQLLSAISGGVLK